MRRSNRRLAYLLLAVLVLIYLASCNSSADVKPQGTYPVDRTFADFYREFGGESALGPAISPVSIKDGLTYQYILSGLMAYDPNRAPLKRFHFAPASTSEWQINATIEPAPDDPSQLYVNGHTIWDEVLPVYEQFGTDSIGQPLTGVIANDAKQRYEQYFEGLGFYRNYTAPIGRVELMPYGAWICADACRYVTPDTPPPLTSYNPGSGATEQIFLQESLRLGYGYAGAPLTSPYVGPDGNYQMVFENMVMYLDRATGGQIQLRSLPSLLGIQADQPVAALHVDWLSFSPVQDNLGYNIPNVFLEYLTDHGGLAYSGNPITEYKSLSDGGYAQCFTNLCLENHPSAPQGLVVRPRSLGRDYFAANSQPSQATRSISSPLQLITWQEYPLISSGEQQTIYIQATQDEQPVQGVEFSLEVELPDGTTQTYAILPAGEDGKTSSVLDPINAPNGSIVRYEACSIGVLSPGVCISNSYIIWDQP